MFEAGRSSSMVLEGTGKEEVPKERGFVLAPGLGALSLLGLVAIILTKTVNIDVKVSTNLLRRAEAEAIADGIARLATTYLAANGASGAKSGQLSLNGAPYLCYIAGTLVSIRIFDSAGLIDINTAPLDVLERMFFGLTQSSAESERLAAAVVDFRDEDDIPLAGGESELEQYRQAGLSHGPKNAPFSTVGELDQVLGIDRALLARLRPLVTVHSRMKGIDPNVASAEMLALPLPSAVVPRTPRQIFVVRVAVLRNRRTRFTREAIVEISARVASGYALREWNQGEDNASEDFDAASDSQSCLALLDS